MHDDDMDEDLGTDEDEEFEDAEELEVDDWFESDDDSFGERRTDALGSSEVCQEHIRFCGRLPKPGALRLTQAAVCDANCCPATSTSWTALASDVAPGLGFEGLRDRRCGISAASDREPFFQ